MSTLSYGGDEVTHRNFFRSSSLLILLATACGNLAPEQRSCDPLASREVPTQLASIVAIGKHADGMTYVIDEPVAGDHRVFISEGGMLVRKRVFGSGTTPTGVIVSVAEATPSFILKAEIDGGRPIRMGVLRGPIAARDFVIGDQGDPLEIAGLDAIKDRPVRNLSLQAYTEYMADLPDDRRILVTRPSDDWGYDDFRLFLGISEMMTERQIHSVSRAKDGGTTKIVFDLDGSTATVHFPAPMRMETAWLQVGPEMVSLGVVSRGTAPEGLTFFCSQ